VILEPIQADTHLPIQALVARYCTAADAGRLDEVIGLFAEDGSIEFRGERFVGADGIKGMFVDSGRRVRASGLRGRLMHTVSTIDISTCLYTPDSAEGSSCFQVLSERGLDHWGRYTDRYVIEHGYWRIERRTITVEGKVPGGFGEVLA